MDSSLRISLIVEFKLRHKTESTSQRDSSYELSSVNSEATIPYTKGQGGLPVRFSTVTLNDRCVSAS